MLSRTRARYPIMERALEDMMDKAAMERPFVIAWARKVGIRVGTGTLTPRTVLDGYFETDEAPLVRQYATDLTGATRIRFYTRSSETVYLFYAALVEGAYDPFDFHPFLDDDGAPLSADTSVADLDWRTLPDARKTTLRLTLSTRQDFAEWSGLSGPFAALVEVS